MMSLEIECSDFASMSDFASLLSYAEGLTSLSLIRVSTNRFLEHGAVGKGQGVHSNH